MKEKLLPVICLTFLILSWPAFAQVKMVKTWYDTQHLFPKEEFFVSKKNPSTLDSTYTSWYQNGNLQIKGNYQRNKATGTWYYFYQNGNLQMKGDMADNVHNGFWEYYYENGNISMKGSLKDGKKEGDWEFFYENGGKKCSGNYKNDQRQGLWKYYYEDGNFKAEASFENDRGTYKEYYENGKVKSEGDIVDGKSSGIWKYYYENGRLKGEGFEKDGQKEGLWKFYHKNGELASEGLFVKGKEEGNWKYYHESGVLSSEGKHKEGEKDGFWKLYYNNGALKGETEFKNGEGVYKEFYENGKLKIEGYIKSGKNDGSWKYYYEDGRLEGNCHFTNGKGYYKGYYPDGSHRMEGLLVDGQKAGVWTLYKDDGSIAGYYKTFYQDSIPVMTPVEIPDTLAKAKRTPSEKPVLKLRKPKHRIFSAKVNELKAVIVSTNPLAPLFGEVPLNFEYYLQERLGHELNFTWINFPLLNKAELNEAATKGFSVHFRQKVYQPDQDMGMFYIAHEFRYSFLDYSMRFLDTNQAIAQQVPLLARERLYEYSFIVGNRIMKDAHKKGYTIDVFVGLGVGYRTTYRNFPNEDYYNKPFDVVKKSNIAVPFRLGLNFGYAFKSKKPLFKLW